MIFTLNLYLSDEYRHNMRTSVKLPNV